jgi:hypothetical protein
MRVLERVAKSLRSTSTHNPNVQVAPPCFLCPDGDRQSEAFVAGLHHELPELCPLGHFVASKRIRPWIWIRFVIASAIKDAAIPSRVTPVLYFPGISRHDLRAVENCPDSRKPLADLQFRGVIWSHVRTRDWTALAFLQSSEGCLSLDMSKGIESKHAMQLALYRLSEEDVEMLRGTHLNKDYRNALLSGGQPVRNLLQWLNQCDPFRTSRGEKASRGFLAVCRSQFWLDPGKDDPLKAATLRALREGSAAGVWASSAKPRRHFCPLETAPAATHRLDPEITWGVRLNFAPSCLSPTSKPKEPESCESNPKSNGTKTAARNHNAPKKTSPGSGAGTKKPPTSPADLNSKANASTTATTPWPASDRQGRVRNERSQNTIRPKFP